VDSRVSLIVLNMARQWLYILVVKLKHVSVLVLLIGGF